MSDPVISFISPNFNRAEFVAETMDSLLAQTDPRWENIIVDDGSTDESEAIIRSYLKRDERFKFHHRQGSRKGACACRNEAVDRSRGRYLVFLDTDDAAAPHCVAQRIRTMDANPDLDFGIFQCELFRHQPGDTGRVWNVDKPKDELSRQMAQDGICQGTGPTFTREAFDRVGRWREDLAVWQDVDLFFRLYIQDYRYAKFLDLPPDVYLRENSDSISRTGFFNPVKIESRSKVLLSAAEQLKKREMDSRVCELRDSAYSVASGAVRSGNHELAAKLAKQFAASGMLGSREVATLQFASLAGRLRLLRIPGVRRLIECLDPSVGTLKSTVGMLPTSDKN